MPHVRESDYTPGRLASLVTKIVPNTTSKPCAGRQAAIRKFPSNAKSIEALLVSSESFRELCEDLAEAERALAATNQLPEALRFPSRVECRGWVESLAKEIEGMLLETKVVPLPIQTLGRRVR